MNQLIRSNFKWTSKDIAEWTGKKHFTVMRDIKDEIQKLDKGGMKEFREYNFVLSSYNTTLNTKSYEMFALTKLGIQQIAMRYDAIVRAKVNQRIEQLEQNDNLIMLSTQTELIENLTQKINNMEKQYMTLKMYCALNKIIVIDNQKGRLGKVLTKHCKKYNITIKYIHSEKYPYLATYPVEVFDKLFKKIKKKKLENKYLLIK